MIADWLVPIKLRLVFTHPGRTVRFRRRPPSALESITVNSGLYTRKIDATNVVEPKIMAKECILEAASSARDLSNVPHCSRKVRCDESEWFFATQRQVAKINFSSAHSIRLKLNALPLYSGGKTGSTYVHGPMSGNDQPEDAGHVQCT